MALDSAALDNLTRSNQVLADADSLLAGTAGLGVPSATSTATSALGSLGALDPTNVGSGRVDDVINTANQGVLDFHSAIETLADENGLIGTVHGVANLGEDVGLGYIGTPGKVLTDVLGIPNDVAAGNPAAAASVIPDALALQRSVQFLGHGVGGDTGLNTQPAQGALPTVSQTLLDGSTAPVGNLVNELTSTAAGLGEHALDTAGLLNTAQGLAGLDTAVLGQNGLVHDVLAAPGQLLAGNTSILSELPMDLQTVVGSVQGVASGVLADLGHGGALSNPLGVVTGAVGGLTGANGDQLLNGVVQDVHATIEGVADGILPGTTHGAVGLGNSVGLGTLGGSNLLTDVLATPGAVASGSLAPVEHLPADVNSALAGVGNLANGVGSDLAASSVLGTLEHPVTGGGVLGGAPVGQGILGEVTSLAGGGAPGVGVGSLGDTIGGLTGGSSQGPLDTVVSTLGGATGGGGLGSLGILGSTLEGLTGGSGHGPLDMVVSTLGGAAGGGGVGNLGDTLSGLTGGSGHGPIDTVVSTLGGAAGGGGLGNLGDTLSGLTGGSGHGPIDTVVSTLGGASGGGGLGGLGNLGGTLGGLTGGSGSGSHDLVTVAVGPQTPTSGVQVDVLSNGGGTSHVVDTHVGTASAATPTLGTISVLGGGSLHFPPASGGGDSLSGMAGSMGGSPSQSGSGSTTPVGSGGASGGESAPPAHHYADHSGAAPHADWFTPAAHGHG